MSVLPEKLSDLIELALADLSKVEADPKYEVNMTNWHVPLGEGRCSVCLAGAVMAGTLNVSSWMQFIPGSFDFKIQPKLVALDLVRRGEVLTALFEIMGDSEDFPVPSPVPAKFAVVPYHINPEIFRDNLGTIVTVLREHGL